MPELFLSVVGLAGRTLYAIGYDAEHLRMVFRSFNIALFGRD